MKKCDCCERIGVKIRSYQQFEELKEFFDLRVHQGIFEEVPVEKPYYVGYGLYENIEWYADKQYKCTVCNTVWEFIYPDFPAEGEVIKHDEA